MHITRLAPSPTGALHLGNARTFLVNWLLARQRGWKIILRIEDLDGPRIKRGADRLAIDDLRWLGIDWDDGPVYQSQRLDRYRAALNQLIESKRAYACVCTRKEVDAAASAPHALSSPSTPDDGAAVYPGTCRDRFATIHEARRAPGGDGGGGGGRGSGAGGSGGGGERKPAIRFDTRGRVVDVSDAFAGPRHYDVERQLGDFVIAKGDGTPAYQLAVVVDDAEMGVSDIVRGDDLLDSTPRQILLYEALGLADKVPTYHHLPLVTALDGRRLAKRHGDTRLATYREEGVPVERLLSLLASWCGIDVGTDGVASAAALLGNFRIDRLPRTPVIFDANKAF